MLNVLKQPGGQVWAADAPNWANLDGKDHLKIGVTSASIAAGADRGMQWYLGQLYGVVGPGLIFAQHVFQGLKRDMLVRNDMKADEKKLAVSWPAPQDAKLVGGPQNGRLEFYPAPAQCVFVVYISPNEMIEQFPDIYGWAEHWTWVAENHDLAGAPIESESRYGNKLWSKG
ncbi:hypothetical protein RFN28_20165 [Mesorhizobium sp. VK24D]|uniref:Uncharacterized protein n=1 Tax=Mesorhizobium album TaxID=3072314 RepID=A0ABU4Y1D8_9HYPH|nr:hypothetical protein [Mesorhizobium sp. VK24D]MDX8480765.1 hypothetical protein [Mesorhizobium sp. VK24D]